MTQLNDLPLQTLQFYATAPYPCSYLPDRQARSQVATPSHLIQSDLYSDLVAKGFRRSGMFTYRPYCDGCQACVPIRVVSEDFTPDRTQRRILRANADLTVSEMPARATAEQFTLFQRYQKNRHADGDMAAMGYYDYRAMIEDTPISTGILEFRDAQDRLLGACLTDWLADGLSAVYSFFDTDQEKRSLGTFAVLWLIGRARSLGLPYVYLGYWVNGAARMQYKTRYRPLERLGPNGWECFDPVADAL